jgi:hypothetical protein
MKITLPVPAVSVKRERHASTVPTAITITASTNMGEEVGHA